MRDADQHRVKSSDVGPSQLCAIFGVGGLGHLAVQSAKIQGATVVAVDLEDGLMAGSKAKHEVWPELADWLRERSGH